ncbi:unnamed protein product [Polarella glacialis]|uniref:Potassium channel domain-containing protein n=1 Tax=Polarella glacialis TaxID=89957 RepID=A0A813KKN1_POLGL|nr:unnamed protein product [Polarella glacialis]
MSQIITTMGYGDITQAKPLGQVFVGLYVLGALFVISMLVSQLTAHVAQMAEEYCKKLSSSSQSVEQLESGRSSALLVISGKPPVPDSKGLKKALVVFFALQAICVLFFHYWPAEGITLSTVGFGAFTPVTEGGMIFGAFMMLFGSAALINVIGAFAERALANQ